MFDYKVAELEEELEAKWKSKMADALTAAKKENEKKLSEVKEEKEAIRGQAVKLKEKVVFWFFLEFLEKVAFFQLSSQSKELGSLLLADSYLRLSSVKYLKIVVMQLRILEYTEMKT